MGLTSRILLVVVGLAALGVPALAVYGWNRLPGTRALRVMERLSLFVLSQGLAVLLALLAVNDQYQFFVSWRDLLGSPPKPGLIAALGDESFTGPYGSVSVFNVRRTQSKDGELISETVRGDRAHLTGRILISLPPGYTSGHRSYPVLELLQGWHAPPESWLTNLHVLDAIRAAERAGRLAPVITVMPDINLGAPRDTECTNIPHGPQTETFLTTDVRDLLLAQYRALPYGKSWGLMGFSTGGYCAAKLALNHPDWYPSAVVMSGYFDAIKDRSTGVYGAAARCTAMRTPPTGSYSTSHDPPSTFWPSPAASTGSPTPPRRVSSSSPTRPCTCSASSPRAGVTTSKRYGPRCPRCWIGSAPESLTALHLGPRSADARPS
jgi:hypothetical protein